MSNKAGFAFIASVLLAVSCAKHDAAGDEQSAFCTRVLEYLPAPGQFIGECVSASSMQEACDKALERLSRGYYVSLGAFGGSITVGFDHSIENLPGFDLAIKGNASEKSCEPGIVWVMCDSNGNSQADDTWYELRGSADNCRRAYSVSYFRGQNRSSILWKDCDGDQGYVHYLGEYHSQESYYPEWVREDSYTLSGTMLPALNYDESGSGNMWINPSYGKGYADNWSDEMLQGYNLFDISDAVDALGQSVDLARIDFVRIQTAVNTSSGWLGEASTEVLSIADYHMLSL